MEWIRMFMLNETVSLLHKFSTLSSFFFFFAYENRMLQKPVSFSPGRTIASLVTG